MAPPTSPCGTIMRTRFSHATFSSSSTGLFSDRARHRLCFCPAHAASLSPSTNHRDSHSQQSTIDDRQTTSSSLDFPTCTNCITSSLHHRTIAFRHILERVAEQRGDAPSTHRHSASRAPRNADLAPVLTPTSPALRHCHRRQVANRRHGPRPREDPRWHLAAYLCAQPSPPQIKLPGLFAHCRL